MQRLDSVLDDFFKQGIFTARDIKEYASRKDYMFETAIEINKILGLYYQSLDYIVETYIADWLQKGFEREGLIQIAKYCFVNSIRRLEGMNKAVEEFYENGLVTESAISAHLAGLMKNDSFIAEVIAVTGSGRNVTDNDRKFYAAWSVAWGFSDEAILNAARIAEGRPYAFTYINKVLSKWKEEGTPSERKAESKTGITLDDEYRIAEIRSALNSDEKYRLLEQERKKLALELSRYLTRGDNVPEEMDKRYKSVIKAMNKRIVILGYSPEELSRKKN